MNVEALSTRLRGVGLVPTIQRLSVLDYMESNWAHPTAEEIYCGLKTGLPSITKATVYNVLDVLKKADLIKELTIARAAARYDFVVEPHPHFLCRVCERLYDVDSLCPIRPGDEVHGHLVEVVQTYLYGVCSRCRRDTDNNSSKTNGRNDA